MQRVGRYFEPELPSDYREVRVIDAKDKRTIVMLNVVAVVLAILVLAISYVLLAPTYGWGEKDVFARDLDAFAETRMLTLAVALLGYMVAHELLHGLVYKVLTGHKLTFGVTLTVAFCGVPEIYTYRTCTLASLLAPFLVFDLVFGVPLAFVGSVDAILLSLLLAAHVSGCSGDLYDVGLLLFRYTNPRTLVNDDGPSQRIYVPEGQA